jgi:beta-carotene 3-hydroxylase
MLVDGLLVIATWLLMEPITSLVHRYVMHGFGMGWHRSHHGRRQGRFERNDLYPVVFATGTIVVMAIGATVPALHWLLPIGIGITAYGVSYLFVHELYIHRRWSRFTARVRVLEPLVRAHALHHRFGGEPYGFLFPIVPTEVAARDHP